MIMVYLLEITFQVELTLMLALGHDGHLIQWLYCHPLSHVDMTEQEAQGSKSEQET